MVILVSLERFPLFRIVSRALRPTLVLMGAAVVAMAVTAACFAIFGPMMGMVSFVVAIGIVPALFARTVGKSNTESLKARWGSIAIGTDGILVEAATGTDFISFAKIKGVRAQGADRVVVRVRGGPRLDLACEDSHELETAIEGACSAYRAAAGLGRAELELGDDDASAFLQRVCALLVAGDFRTRPVGEGDLAAVAMDPKAQPLQRVGAVAALKDASGPTRVKIRVAVEGTADPELRGALEEALDETLTEETVIALGAEA